MRGLRSGGRISLAVLGLLVLSRQAQGQPATQDAFLLHVKEGERLYEARQYEAALREFDAAYAIRPDPRLQCNRGNALLFLGRAAAEAHAACKRCQQGQVLSPEDREEAKECVETAVEASREQCRRGAALCAQWRFVEGRSAYQQCTQEAINPGREEQDQWKDHINQCLQPPIKPTPDPQSRHQLRPVWKQGWFWATMAGVTAAAVAGGVLISQRSSLGPQPDPCLVERCPGPQAPQVWQF